MFGRPSSFLDPRSGRFLFCPESDRAALRGDAGRRCTTRFPHAAGRGLRSAVGRRRLFSVGRASIGQGPRPSPLSPSGDKRDRRGQCVFRRCRFGSIPTKKLLSSGPGPFLSGAVCQLERGPLSWGRMRFLLFPYNPRGLKVQFWYRRPLSICRLQAQRSLSAGSRWRRHLFADFYRRKKPINFCSSLTNLNL